jgi:threonine/homoserine/homoserine lactone efflux protein
MIGFNFAEWCALTSICCLAIISPGPDFMVVSKVSLERGFQAGILATLGIFLGSIIHSAYSILGLGAWLQTNPSLLHGIRLAGSSYLIYLGVSSLIGYIKAQKSPLDSNVSAVQASRELKVDRSSFMAGLLTNLLNPKAVLFTISLYTQIIENGTPLSHCVIYAATGCIAALIWFSLVARLFSTPGKNPAIQLFQTKGIPVMAILLIGIGLRAAWG